MEPEEVPDSPPHDELGTRPGNQAGWKISLEGERRCTVMGHEVDSTMEMTNGMLVGYCVRCTARFEMPWFRGGTVAVLARHMAVEAMDFDDPAPSVLEDLSQVAGLLVEDCEAMGQAHALVVKAANYVNEKLNS